MEESEVGKLSSSHAVAYAHYGTRHIFSKCVDHVKEVPTVVEPGRWMIISNL